MITGTWNFRVYLLLMGVVSCITFLFHFSDAKADGVDLAIVMDLDKSGQRYLQFPSSVLPLFGIAVYDPLGDYRVIWDPSRDIDPNGMGNHLDDSSVSVPVERLIATGSNDEDRPTTVFHVSDLYCFYFAENLETEMSSTRFMMIGVNWPVSGPAVFDQFSDGCVQYFN